MKVNLLFILNLLVCSSIIAQNSYKVKLIQPANPVFYRFVNGEMGLSMYDFNQACLAELKRKIIFPKIDFIPEDTAYAELTRQSTKVNGFLNQFYFIIYNYKSYCPVILVSSSYDFSKADVFKISDKNILKLSFKTDVNTLINYYMKIDTTKDYMDAIGKMDYWGCNPVPIKYNISIMNDFAKVGDFDNFSIGLYDLNNNGLFNEVGTDQLFIGTKGERYFLFNFDINQTSSGTFIKNKIIFAVRDKKYEIVKIDRAGNYVTIKPYYGKQIPDVKQFESIPDLNVQLSNGDSLNLRKEIDHKKYVYLEIWTKSCPSCISDLPILDKIGEKYRSKLNFLGLYDRGNLNELNSLIEKYQIKNKQALSSDIVNYNLSLDGYPYGILFSEKGELIKAYMTRTQLVEFLEKN